MNSPNTANPFKVAIIQHAPVFLNIQANLEKACALIEQTAVIAPNSDYVKGPVFNESCIIYAEIQPERITEGHLFLDTQGHYSRPDIFHLEVNDQPQSSVNFKSQSKQG